MVRANKRLAASSISLVVTPLRAGGHESRGRGRRSAAAVLLVSNHLSYVDFRAQARGKRRLLQKKEIEDWFLPAVVNQWAMSLSTALTPRYSRAGALVIKKMSERRCDLSPRVRAQGRSHIPFNSSFLELPPALTCPCITPRCVTNAGGRPYAERTHMLVG